MQFLLPIATLTALLLKLVFNIEVSEEVILDALTNVALGVITLIGIGKVVVDKVKSKKE